MRLPGVQLDIVNGIEPKRLDLSSTDVSPESVTPSFYFVLKGSARFASPSVSCQSFSHGRSSLQYTAGYSGQGE
jgi:hypothetical protein